MLQYEALNVPYPADKGKMLADIDADEKAAVSDFICIENRWEDGHLCVCVFVYVCVCVCS